MDIGRTVYIHNTNSKGKELESSKDTREWTLDRVHITNCKAKELESSKDTIEWT